MWKFRTKKEAIAQVEFSSRVHYATNMGEIVKVRSRWIVMSNIHRDMAVGDHGWLYEIK